MPTRQLSLRSAGLDEGRRILTAIVASENIVNVFDKQVGHVIPEVLMLDGLEPTDQVPMLIDHERSVRSTVGSATNFARKGDEIEAALCFATGPQLADEVWHLANQHHLKSVSVGYAILETRQVQPGQSATIGGRTFSAPVNRPPLQIVTKWKIREISLVPIGADETTNIRSDPNSLTERNHAMSTTLTNAIGHRDVANMTLAEFSAASLRSRGQELPQNDKDMFRAAMDSVPGVNDLLGIVNVAVLDGYRNSPDTLAGTYRTTDTSNYLQNELARLEVHPRMEHVGRGETAPSAVFGMSSTGYRLMRFGLQFAIDEQDVEDSKALGTYQLALAEIGASVRRLVSDLLWSVVLANPTLSDDVALFDASRNNLATGGGSALSESSLDAAIGAIGNQISTDEQDDPVHLGAFGKFLVVPPAKFGLAKRLVRNMSTGRGDLFVRSESRLSAINTVDPRTDSLTTGNGNNWLLAAPAVQAPSLVLGLLFGKAEPDVRSYKLDSGSWGIGFDIVFSCAVAAVDGRPLYWAEGQ